MNNAEFNYSIYIKSASDIVWNALIDPEITSKYWQHINESDWKINSKWYHKRSDGSGKLDMVGNVLEFRPTEKLVLSWAFTQDENNRNKYSEAALFVKPYRDVTLLTIIHSGLESDSDMLTGIALGWPKVFSSLKSLLETGSPLPVLW